MGASDVVKTAIVVARLVGAVIAGNNMAGEPARQLEQWSKVQTSSWISQGLTESAVTDRLRSKASSLRSR